MSCVHHGSVVSPPGHVLASIIQGEIDTSQRSVKGVWSTYLILFLFLLFCLFLRLFLWLLFTFRPVEVQVDYTASSVHTTMLTCMFTFHRLCGQPLVDVSLRTAARMYLLVFISRHVTHEDITECSTKRAQQNRTMFLLSYVYSRHFFGRQGQRPFN